MKLVFFSSDRLEVKRVSQALLDAGISCEVRGGTVPADAPPDPLEAEVWVASDRDCSRAFMLCVEAGVGFAKRRVDTSDAHFWNEALAA